MNHRSSKAMVCWLFVMAVFLIWGRSAFAQNCVGTLWCDDFTGIGGTAPDPTKWTYDHGNLNVNNELEFYCRFGESAAPCDPTKPNASLDGNGNLVIQANRITTSQAPYSNAWTSARLLTSGLATFTYGRVEARMKLPVGPGIWPAFWALGSNIGSVGWPNCGEMDFMENVPTAPLGPTTISSTIHGPTYFGSNGLSSRYTFPSAGQVDTAFHIYGAIWSPSMVQFYVDVPANVFLVKTASDVPGGAAQWAFNHPVFLLANLAVGGTGSWPGPPDGTTPNPAVMLVDFVRVFQNAAVTGPGMAASPLTVKAGTPGNTTLNVTGTSTNDGRVYLTCSTNAPKAACAISTSNALSPFVVDFGSGTNKTATVSVTTTANAMLLPFRWRPKVWFWAPVGLFVLIVFHMLYVLRTGGSIRRRRYAMVTVLVLSAALVVACGGNSYAPPPPSGGTTPGSYTITVNAYTTSGNGTSPDSTASVNLTVN